MAMGDGERATECHATGEVLQPQHRVVLRAVREHLRRCIPAGPLTALCERWLTQLEDHLQEHGSAPCIDVPYLVAQGLGANAEKTRTVAVFATSIFLGCDLLDDFHDQAWPRELRSASVNTVSLAGSLLLSVIPTLVIAEIPDLSDAGRFHACRMVAEYLQRMAGGQADDLRSPWNPELSIDATQSRMMAKSGEEMALFCHFSALVTGCDAHLQQECAQFGREMAMALQIISDLTDLFEKPVSTDLQQGTGTLPLALHLARLETGARKAFCGLWRESAHSPAARRRLQWAMCDSGAVAHAAVMIESYGERAKERLHGLPLHPASQHALQEEIATLSRYALAHLQAFLHHEPEKPSDPLFLHSRTLRKERTR
ncbi:MAG: polyprenyl synthetase family protein [Deltaproteobacteria bacterium]|nr:polyprenyl synthetase family protein [Deltaproteobacteria bacterium]